MEYYKTTADTLNYSKLIALFDVGTYCYTLSSAEEDRIKKEYCRVRKCKSSECRMAGTGNDYVGKIAVTRSNRTCQHWYSRASAAAQIQNETDTADSSTIKNLPNNFLNSITKKQIGRTYVDVPDMLNNILKYNRLLDDRGCTEKWRCLRSDASNAESPELFETLLQNVSAKERSEQIQKLMADASRANATLVTGDESSANETEYTLVHHVDDAYLNGTLFPDMYVQKAENFCRNPSRSLAGSWCYTSDPDVPRDACNVRDCDKPEEYTIIITGKGRGRDVYMLPQWKERGHHGGIKFSAKQWNPDFINGIIFEITSLDGASSMKLVIGADNNEKLRLYYNSERIKEKTLPHIIPSGKWVSFWLQLRQGEIQLGLEGVPNPLFEWTHGNISDAFSPVFLNYRSSHGYPIGMFFKKDECHTERTYTTEYSKFFPIGLWFAEEKPIHRNFTLNIRGTGGVNIPLFVLPDSDDFYSIGIQQTGSVVVFYKHTSGLGRVLKTTYPQDFFVAPDQWTRLDISFIEQWINVTSKNRTVLLYKSPVPMLFYWFSVNADDGWITWTANCEPLDIDGRPVDGGWSKWSPWICSVSCGGGDGYRTRTCSNPRPNIFGQLCEGSPTITGRCNNFVCGDISPETMEKIREYLQSNSHSLLVKESDSITIYNNNKILTIISNESPEAYYEWTLNGVFVDSEEGRIEFLGDDIVIHKTEISDIGVYVCMLYRINKQRLVIHVVSLAVTTKHYQIETRATRKLILNTNAVVLGYVYTNLRQKWLLNGKSYKDYGITTLAAVSSETLDPLNESHTGEWRCIIEQSDLGLNWTSNVVKILVKKRPNIYTNLMEDDLTKPLFGWLKTELKVFIALVFIIVFVCVTVVFGLFAYLRWGRLPELQYQRKKRNRRFN